MTNLTKFNSKDKRLNFSKEYMNKFLGFGKNQCSTIHKSTSSVTNCVAIIKYRTSQYKVETVRLEYGSVMIWSAIGICNQQLGIY